MWRSFFFAVGLMLIILGLECLVAESFVVSSQARLPGFVKKILDEKGKTPPSAQNGANSVAQNVLIPQTGSFNNGSRFGPSRFDSQYGSGGFYGGRPNQIGGQTSQNQFQTNPQFSLAGYGSPAANSGQLVPQSFGGGASVTGVSARKNRRKCYTRKTGCHGVCWPLELWLFSTQIQRAADFPNNQASLNLTPF